MTGLAAAIRALHILSLAILVGGLGFVLFVARPAFQRAGREALDSWRKFERLQRRLTRWALLGVFLTFLLGLMLQVAAISGSSLGRISSDEISDVITGTQYGRVWLIRLALLVALSVLFLRRSDLRQEGSTGLGWADFLLACATAVTLALSGHATAGEGTTLFVQVVADALHLLAAAVWLGGLVPLAMLLHWAHSSTNVPVAQEATRRFSLLGVASVFLLVVTGFVNARSLVGGFAPLVGTPYGGLLMTKLGVLLPLVGLAAFNLLWLKPGLLASDRGGSLQDIRGFLRRLKRNVVAEASLGVVIIVIVGWMGFTPPARHIQPSWPFSFRWSWATIKTSPKVRSEVFFGTGLGVFGLFSLGAASLRQRERYWIGGVGLACIAYGGAVALPALSTDAYPTTYMKPSVPYHAISVANGLRLYRENCALCHGVAGYGDGPAAEGLKPRPADLTGKHAGDHTAGDLFWWLSHGIQDTAMPGYGAALSPEERWDLINFMRTLSAGEQARPMAPLIEPTPWLVAPDFSYRASNGEEKTLKDHRGERVVLLLLFTLPYSRERLAQIDQSYPKLKSLGAEVLAIPQDDPAFILDGRIPVRNLPVITDGGQEAFDVYGLFRRSFSAEGSLPDPPMPPHMEFLIDRQGYIRARWIPGDGVGWTKTEALVREIEQLVKEKPRASAPDEHVH